MCDVIDEDAIPIPINLNFPWITVMCDATQHASPKSRKNHRQVTESKAMIDIIVIAAITTLVSLLIATAYAATQYYKQLLRAQEEYGKARDIVEDVVLSFNRELRREAERLSNVSYEVEGAVSQANAGLKKANKIEERILPLEVKVENVSADVANLTSVVGTITEGSAKILEKISSFDANGIDAKIQSIETTKERVSNVDLKIRDLEQAQENLKAKLVGIEEQLQKQPAIFDRANEYPPQISVMPIKREKAMASLTDTEVATLELLVSEGPKTAPEIKEKVHLSREHTARLMKKLYEEGYLERETGKLPFRYSLKKEMEKLLKKPEPSAT